MATFREQVKEFCEDNCSILNMREVTTVDGMKYFVCDEHATARIQ